MMYKTKKILLVAILVCVDMTLSQVWASSSSQASSDCCSGCSQSQNLWQPHAFSISMSREILLEKSAWTIEYDTEGWFGTFGVGFDYIKSLDANTNCEPKKCCTSMGSIPFWSADQSNQMTIGDNSGLYDLDAYQMGLGPVTTNGTVRLDPTTYQMGGDFLLYAGEYRTEYGFFFKLNAPVGMTCVYPRISHAGDLVPQPYLSGELEAGEEIDPLYLTIKEAFAGGNSAGDLVAMNYGTIVFKKTSEMKLGDLAATIGYNFYADETKHIGAGAHFTAPTGNKANPVYVLDPIFGRNGHWAVGFEIMGHWRVWESEQCARYVELWFDGIADHLFRSEQSRSFDLKANGLGSKYLLLANYANNTYQNEITNAVNVITLPITSVFNIEGNAAAMVDVHWDRWSLGLGYEAWGRTCEKLSIACPCPLAIDLNNYAILGRQNVVNGLCQPTATIGKSEDVATVATDTIVDATNPKNRLPSDAYKAINIDGQRAHAAYTNKIFGQVAYTCTYIDCKPYVAISGGAEFSMKKNSAVSFWNIGAQGGVAF